MSAYDPKRKSAIIAKSGTFTRGKVPGSYDGFRFGRAAPAAIQQERIPMNEPGQVLRALHEESGAFVMPNPWDIGSARILEAMGFKALATTSAGMAFALGMPDGRVSREATLGHCSDIVAATPLPVSADLEKGFGDTPESVFGTITTAAAIGLAGCSIEDHTGRLDAPIFEMALAVERIEAASPRHRDKNHHAGHKSVTCKFVTYTPQIRDLHPTNS